MTQKIVLSIPVLSPPPCLPHLVHAVGDDGLDLGGDVCVVVDVGVVGVGGPRREGGGGIGRVDLGQEEQELIAEGTQLLARVRVLL